ncbi:DoxX family protein [Mycobacterium intracellulare]|uniref:DoxX family protein n=1 Tax=Mycobacterium intracellulare TaxID=1767 RepID=UPI001CD9BC6A|nr:DoxX family protein [Mycobacterium intracellulare]MCA2276757.1 DoxX family protein [Mycobacterium intracellulare]MCA2328444.1 DoxX family protein [Mycobacterium intracellulare]
MDAVILVGRIVFAAVFIGAAIGHLSNTAALSAYVEAVGLRPGRLFVVGSAVWMLAASILLVLGAWIDVAALMLVVFLVATALFMHLPTALYVHHFWPVTDAETQVNEQNQFTKDLSLAGGALLLFGFAVKTGNTLAYTLTAPLFS